MRGQSPATYRTGKCPPRRGKILFRAIRAKIGAIRVILPFYPRTNRSNADDPVSAAHTHPYGATVTGTFSFNTANVGPLNVVPETGFGGTTTGSSPMPAP
jgi:hypothetical protein